MDGSSKEIFRQVAREGRYARRRGTRPEQYPPAAATKQLALAVKLPAQHPFAPGFDGPGGNTGNARHRLGPGDSNR